MSSPRSLLENDSITSILFHKQDEFWANIICKCKKSIECLKINEQKMQNHLLELKLLTYCLYTFTLLKLLDIPYSHQATNALIQLKCPCPQAIHEGVCINLANINFIFDIKNEDLKYMTAIKELKNRENVLIGQVNKFRIKDSVLVNLKRNIDELAKESCQQTIGYKTEDDSLSDMPENIKELLKENRIRRDELDDVKKENIKMENIVRGSLMKRLVKLRNDNDSQACNIRRMKQDSKRDCDCANRNVMDSFIKHSRDAAADLLNVVERIQKEVDLLKYSINNMKELTKYY